MASYYVNPHSHQCPWYPYAELFGSPNIKWCEQTMCHWVSEPINTYTNAAYLIVAAVLFFFAWRKKQADINMFPNLMLGIAIASTLYHLSSNYFTQLLDFLAIFLFVFWPFTLNMVKMGKISEEKKMYLWGAITTFFMILVHIFYLYFLKFQVLVAVAGFLLLVSEFFIYKESKAEDRPKYHFLIAGMVVIGIGQTFSLLDVTRVLCDPQNHWFQGHALWHVLSAIGLGLAFGHWYLQYENLSADSYDDLEDGYYEEMRADRSEGSPQLELIGGGNFELDEYEDEEEPAEVQITFDDFVAQKEEEEEAEEDEETESEKDLDIFNGDTDETEVDSDEEDEEEDKNN